MNAGSQFWLNLWREGKTIFHRTEVNPDLSARWASLQLPPDATVLVPLCGKSLDMLWLMEQGFRVIGIELSEQAALQFSEENQLTLVKKIYPQAISYRTKSLTIWVANIFSLDQALIVPADAIYDRAALIALPANLRAHYVRCCLQWLKARGKILLKTMYYDDSEMEGPPFSVADEEIRQLYSNCPIIQNIGETSRQVGEQDPLYARGLRQVTDKVWSLQAQ
ncbi:thiopurine S-methyltransferase [Legionella feeleii]|uniref:Thiopurine S-methyltransferase n=1 Tax=Legionella feeleii TaxID=453 RepID=A0A378IPP8_9GAMM|nr:thiopurine S-methyltransferase [Legionella feeleii]STX37033.1 thiopurine S-methyltransferase [Legionella feeleii]